jgi:hypothetical protein
LAAIGDVRPRRRCAERCASVTAGGLDDGGAADRDEPGAIIVTIAMPRLDLRRLRIDAAVRDANLMDPGAHRLAIQKQHKVVVALYTVQGNVMQLEEGSR